MEDRQLLDRYVHAGDQEALGRLVSRYVDFVYSVALRQVGDPHLAEDVVQAVFLILVRKAHSIGPRVVLGGWLFNTTRYAASNALRTQRRRDHHERHAGALRSEMEPSADPPAADEYAEALDWALSRLNPRDRDTLLLRFYHGKSLRQVGQETGVTEDTARVRVSRAIRKLRTHLLGAGVMLSGTGPPMMDWLRRLAPAPPGLAESVVISVLGEATTATATSIASATLAAIAWTKAKSAAAIAAAIMLVGAAGVVVVAPPAARGVPPDAHGMVELSIGARQTVDLDERLVRPAPPEARGDLGKLLEIAATSGFDGLAAVRSGSGMVPRDFVGLVTTDLTFRAVSADDWDQMVALQDLDAIRRLIPTTSVGRGMSLMGAENPHYVFATREGAIGLLEFVRVPAEGEPGPIRVRYLILAE